MNVMDMQQPNLVLRCRVPKAQLTILEMNLLNLNNWPMWNKCASRILSEKQGQLSINQRFDLHRIIAQQLIEDMWLVRCVKQGKNPKFCQLILEWQGQTINGRVSALAIKELIVDITILHELEEGVEVTAWWKVTRLSSALGFGSRLSRKIVQQIFDDLTRYGISRFEE